VYNTPVNEQKIVQVSVCPETSTCRHTGDVEVISTAVALCGSHSFQRSFQVFAAQRCVLCRRFLVHSNLLTGILCLVLNTPKSLDVPAAKIFRGLRSGDRAGRLTGSPRHVHCSPKVWFRCCLTVRRKRGDAISCLNRICRL
jgi:hypothetical protein